MRICIRLNRCKNELERIPLGIVSQFIKIWGKVKEATSEINTHTHKNTSNSWVQTYEIS